MYQYVLGMYWYELDNFLRGSSRVSGLGFQMVTWSPSPAGGPPAPVRMPQFKFWQVEGNHGSGYPWPDEISPVSLLNASSRSEDSRPGPAAGRNSEAQAHWQWHCAIVARPGTRIPAPDRPLPGWPDALTAQTRPWWHQQSGECIFCIFVQGLHILHILHISAKIFSCIFFCILYGIFWCIFHTFYIFNCIFVCIFCHILFCIFVCIYNSFYILIDIFWNIFCIFFFIFFCILLCIFCILMSYADYAY